MEWLTGKIAFRLVRNIFNFCAISDANITTVVNYATEAVPTCEGYETFDKIFLCYN